MSWKDTRTAPADCVGAWMERVRGVEGSVRERLRNKQDGGSAASTAGIAVPCMRMMPDMGDAARARAP